MPHLHPSAVVLAPEVLMLDPAWRQLPAGILPPRWLGEDADPLPPLIAQFVAIVRGLMPADHRVGTLGGRIIDDPCDTGHWHADSGVERGQRYAVTVHVDPAVACGHEFAHLSGPLPSGHVATWREAIHRRPRAARGRRVFLSAATYPTHVDADLTCVLLRELAPTP